MPVHSEALFTFVVTSAISCWPTLESTGFSGAALP